MKHIKLFEDFVNEASDKKPAILVKLYNELSKAKNKKSLTWGYDDQEEFPHTVDFENGLESQSDRHEGDLEEYSFYLNDDGKTILGIYNLSGYAEELKTPKDAVNWCRANESVNESISTEDYRKILDVLNTNEQEIKDTLYKILYKRRI